MQQPTDQDVRQRKEVPRPYLDTILVPGQYLGISLVAGKCKIYCPAMAFDPPKQSVTFINNVLKYCFKNCHAS